MRRRERQADHGVTLIELLVAMSLTSILLVVISTVYLTSLRAMGQERARTSMTGEARIAMESVARRARVAIRPSGETNAIVTATATQLVLYSAVNTTSGVDAAPLRAEYFVQGNCLMEARTPARTLASPGPAGQVYAWDTGRKVTCLAHLKGSPAFTYFASAELSSSGTGVAPITVPAAGLSATARTDVRSIGFTLTVADPDKPDAGGMKVTTRVTLPNLVTGAVGG